MVRVITKLGANSVTFDEIFGTGKGTHPSFTDFTAEAWFVTLTAMLRIDGRVHAGSVAFDGSLGARVHALALLTNLACIANIIALTTVKVFHLKVGTRATA